MDEVTPSARTARPRLISGPLALVFVCSFGSMIGFYLLFAVVPLYATSVGAGGAGAGFTTGALMLTTVAAELALPRLTARFGYRRVLVAGLLLLGLPVLALPASTGLAGILAVCLVRGFGFAAAVVVCGALVAELVPAERRGEGIGVSGIVLGVPAMTALPAGVWLAGRFGYTPVFLASAATSLIALLAVFCLPGHGRAAATRPARPEPRDAAGGYGMAAGLRSPALLRPASVFAISAAGAGIVATFLPAAVPGGDVAAAGLLVQAAAATLTRWWSGRVGDRHGPARLLAPGVLVAGAGMLTLLASPGTVAVLVAMALFGAGFGVAQNASLAVMFERVPLSGYSTVSAVWNLGYDGGMGLGGAGFGLLAAQTGYPPAFALTGAVMLLAVPVAFRDRGVSAIRPEPSSVRAEPRSVLDHREG